MFATDTPVMPFQPKPEDLRFYSEAEGVRYARGAGFAVTQEDGVVTATRPDMPEKVFVLRKDREKPDKLVWVLKR